MDKSLEVMGSAFFDHTTSRFFSRDPYLWRMRRKLVDRAVLRMGDVAKRTEAEFLALVPGTTHAGMRRVKNLMANVEMAFGMNTNGWDSPERRPLKRKSELASRHIT